MRLALVGPVYPFRGGIAHYTTLLHRSLIERGHDVRLYSFTRQYPAWLFPGRSDRDPSEGSYAGDCTYVLDTINPLTWQAAARLLCAYRPEVLVLQWWVPIFAPMWAWLARAARAAGSRTIFICHNVLPHETRAWDRGLARWTLRRGAGFVVGARSEEVRLNAMLPGKPVAVVPHPINDLFAGRVWPQAEGRRRLGLDPEAPVLLFFGFVRPYKGLQYLLEAMPAVRAVWPGAHLLIVGEFWHDKVAYLQKIAALGLEAAVTIVDRYVSDDEIPLYFSAANAAVLPYVTATQSAVVQVAFGLGVPVITTSTGGLPDEVLDGVNGLLVPPADSPALAAAITRFLGSGLEPAMRQNLTARQGYRAWDVLVDALVELSCK